MKSDIVNLSKHNELINGYGLLNTNVYLSKEVAKKFSEMINNVVKEGVNQFLINSGYRDFDEQSGLYHGMRADYALPAGYSEHNSGLSLDVGIGFTKTDRAPEGKWIEKMLGNNALSYAIPRIKRMLQVFNMNLVIFAMSVCLTVRLCQNEFILGRISGLFKRRRGISASIQGKKYTILYYPFFQNKTIDVEMPVNEFFMKYLGRYGCGNCDHSFLNYILK